MSVGRGLARRPPACAEHPHRAAVDHCDVCGRVYCRECLVRGGPQLMCAACWASAPQREAEAARRRRPFYRLRRAWQEERAEVVAGGAIVVTLALLAFSSLGGLINPRARAEMAIPVARWDRQRAPSACRRRRAGLPRSLPC
ncbi:MAG TPA: hypothetical protein VHS99_20550 [Chloroflexota bacterium]|nr:hypothetical protein [Chloroflexota bacterium]